MDSWFFKKINKIDNPSVRLTKKKRVKTQVNKNRNEREWKPQKFKIIL